jgi:hypothetical protein
MGLVLSPNTAQEIAVNHPLCFQASSGISIPAIANPIPISSATDGVDWSYNPSTATFVRNGTSLPGFAIIKSDYLAYGKQPFWVRGANTSFLTPGSPNNNVHWFIGIEKSSVTYSGLDVDNSYWVEVMKYCNSNTSTCGVTTGSNWVMTVHTPTAVYTRNVNFNEQFFVRSDGVSLIFEHIQGGTFITDYVMTLPDTDSWRFIAGAFFLNNQFSWLATWLGTYQGTVPITWTTPLGGTLTGDSNTAKCFTANAPGAYQVCAVTDFDTQICVPVTVDDLTLSIKDGNCGDCVFTGDTVKFESNGGLDGILSVKDDNGNPIGTVIDSLTWQAPGVQIHANATYTLDGVYFRTCSFSVVPRFEILNVIGDTITGLVPGDLFQLKTNYDFPDDAGVPRGTVVWENLDCDKLVSPSGLISIPQNYRNPCFGMTDCYIRARILRVPGAECPNLTEGGSHELFEDVRIKINPVFPTPEFGGPMWTKWKPETPDFRVIEKTMEGGCSETHIRNRVPVMRWTVSYANLPYQDILCPTTDCCDEPAGFVNGFDPTFQTIKMIDDFWMLVGGESGYFTLVDPRTNEVWENVRFENKMQKDHINWHKTQNRTLSLIWNPCCATSPKGGVCEHSSVIKDTQSPTIPLDLFAEPMSSSRIDLSWLHSVDNVGVFYYEIEIDGIIVTIESTPTPVMTYSNIHLEPDSIHNYRVRAVDFSGNPSDWTEYVSATTTAAEARPVFDGVDFVEEDTDFVVDG